MANLVVASVDRSDMRDRVNLQTSVSDVMSLAAALGTDGVMIVADPLKMAGTLNLEVAVKLLLETIVEQAQWPTVR